MKQLLSIIFLFIYPLFLFSQDNCTDLNEDAICDEFQIVGCTNPEACNFNADAQFSDLFSCIYSEECSEADSCIGIYDEETESCNSNLITVKVIKVHDITCNGEFDAGESYLDGWDFQYMTGNYSGTVTTNSTGVGFIYLPLSETNITIWEEPFDYSNSFVGYEPYGGQYSYDIDLSSGDSSYTLYFYNCPCTMIEGYKYLDNDCNCEFSDGDTTLSDWPIIISAGYIGPTWQGPPGYIATMDTIYTDSDGKWSYCISSQDLLEATNFQNVEYFSVSEGMLPGYYACEEVIYEQKLYGSTGLQANVGNPLTGGIYDAIPIGSKFSFFNCPEPATSIYVNVYGCKIEDVDCDGVFTQGIDNYLPGWTINWDTGYEMGSVVTDQEGCYELQIPIPSDFIGEITLSENMQNGYIPWGDNDVQTISVGEDEPIFEVNFYNCPEEIEPYSISVCKIEDVDCDGQFTQGVDNYLPGWTINWIDDNGFQGSVITEDTGCNSVTLYGSEATFWEEMQDGYSAFEGNDEINIEIASFEDQGVYFFNCPDPGCPQLPAECVIDGALNISTGYDNSINALMPTTNLSANQIVSDPYWILIGSPDPSVLTGGPANVIPPYSSAWETSSLSQYISAYTIAANQVTPQIQGGAIIEDPYKFQNCFCVCDGGEVYIDLGVSSDNYAELYLIKDADSATPTTVLIGSTPGPVGNYYTTQNFNNFWPMDYSGNLDPGTHCLEAHLWNQDSGQGMGLNVQGTVSTANGALEDYLCCAGQSYISGTKYIDQDCDGLNFNLNSLLSPDTNGGSGWEITLYDDNNNIIATTFTDNNGNYNFVINGNESPSGNYVITETQQNGYSSSLASQTITNFGLNGYEAITVDFINCPDPFVPDDSATVCVYKIIDNDCDGSFSIGDEYGTGWHMSASGYGDGFTNGYAGWCFEVPLSSLDPNNSYISVSEDVINCYTSNPSAFQDVYIDPYNDANYSVYFYNCPDSITIEGYKIIDEDGDGVFTQGVDTYGIGWDIFLESNGVNSSYDDQTTTDNNGYYSFNIPSNLDISEFLVWESQQAGFNPCSEDSIYVEGLDTCHYEINFFNCPISTYTVVVEKVVDWDCNGEFGSGDELLEGWEIFWESNNYSGSVLTDINGQATIELPVTEQQIMVWEDFNNSIFTNGFNYSYEVFGDDYEYVINFDPDLNGYDYSYTFYNCPCITIDGYKYLDNDCNCEFTDGDSVLEDWPIIISAGYITQNAGAGQPGFTATMDTVYTDSQGYWSYCISQQGILDATNGQNPEYFSVSEGMLPGYYACEEVVYEQKLFGPTGLQANNGNPLTGGDYAPIPDGSKFSFFNCPDQPSTVTVTGCKIEDVDCDGIFTQGVDNYLPGWTINWDNGYEMGYIQTDSTGCYVVEVPIPSDFEGTIIMTENMQDGYTPWQGNDLQEIEVDFDMEDPYTVNFFNCPTNSCVEIIEYNMYCQDDIFYLDLVLENTTNVFDFSQYTLVPMDPELQSSPSYFNNTWNIGNTNTFSLEIFNVTDHESICFFFSAFNCLADEDCEDCCSEVLCFDVLPCPESSLFDFDLNGYVVYPNPVRDKFIIQSELPTDYTYTVYDSFGKKIITNTGNGEETIQSSKWSNGIYMLVIQDEDNLPKQYKIIVHN